MANRIVIGMAVLALVAVRPAFAKEATQPVSAIEICEAIDRGCNYLLRQQKSNGEYPADGLLTHPIAVTSLATLALLDCGITTAAPPVQQSLRFLEKVTDNESLRTHDLALLTLALVAAHEPAYLPKIKELTTQLAARQRTDGGWGSSAADDRSQPNLSQLSLLALREATSCGIATSGIVWSQARRYWQTTQRTDGGWYDVYRDPTRGEEAVGAFAQTLTALSALSTCQRMLEIDEVRKSSGINGSQQWRPDDAIRRGIDWLHNNVTTRSDPGRTTTSYLLGLERAGRLGTTFIREDLSWYQDGAALLLRQQDPATGKWTGNNDVISTSHALLFLARGLAPVVINNLVDAAGVVTSSHEAASSGLGSHGPGSLSKFISGRPGWPSSVVAQDVPIGTDSERILNTLKQAPIVLLTGRTITRLGTAEKSALQMYLSQGGILLASPRTGDTLFEQEFRKLVEVLLPAGQPTLNRLDPDHPIYRSEFAIPVKKRQLLAVDAGCRTSILYCPMDLPSLWALSTRYGSLVDDKAFAGDIEAASQIGTNILAYASGKVPPGRFDIRVEPAASTVAADRQEILIGHLTLAGTPRLAGNLQRTLRENAGLEILVEAASLRDDDARLHEFAVLMLHGSKPLTLSAAEATKLKSFLDRGGVLFVDACCGSEDFDRSFRKTIADLLPNEPLRRIPVDNAIFSSRTAHDLQRVKHQFYDVTRGQQTIEETSPLLEAVTRGGRFQVIYSKRDITCALEQPLVLGCNGYLPPDAFRITMNILLESLLQQVQTPGTRNK